MSNKDKSPYTGIVEIDETYIGGKMKNKHSKERKKLIDENGSSSDNKIGGMGFLERGKEVRVEGIKKTETFKQMVRSNVHTDAVIITDSNISYKGLVKEYSAHEVLNHINNEYVKGIYHTNSSEDFWNQVKKTIRGTHIHVSEKHLQKYLDKVVFRYAHREKQATMFEPF